MPPSRSSSQVLVPLMTLALPALLACGGEPTPPASPAAVPGGGGDAAERCLAIAGAKRERKPNEPAKVSAKHVLVKYAGAKKAPPAVTRTREQACLRAQEARAKLEQGMPFAEVVAAYSEEPGATTREARSSDRTWCRRLPMRPSSSRPAR